MEIFLWILFSQFLSLIIAAILIWRVCFSYTRLLSVIQASL